MLEVMGKILSSLVRSLFVSAVMLLIALSLLTGEFPPSFGKLQNMFAGLQKISDLNRNLQTIAVKSLVEPAADSSEADVLALQQLNKQRAEVGSSILGASVPGANSVNSENAETQNLRETVRELQRQVYKLQSRVADLEDISAKK